MSSRLIPPTVGSSSWQKRTRSRASSEPTSRSNTSMSANALNRIPLPSITGLPASAPMLPRDRKSTRLNSSHRCISYAVFCLKKTKKEQPHEQTQADAQDQLDATHHI